MSDSFYSDDDTELVEFCGVRIEVPSNLPILLFKRKNSNIYLPITIGMPEATSIMFALQGTDLPRPMTHDLFMASLAQHHAEIKAVHISQVVDGTYYAEMVFNSPAGEYVLSARPSDAVALGVRSKAIVEYSANRELFDEAGVELDADNAEDEIEQFRDFLDEITPDDFQ